MVQDWGSRIWVGLKVKREISPLTFPGWGLNYPFALFLFRFPYENAKKQEKGCLDYEGATGGTYLDRPTNL